MIGSWGMRLNRGRFNNVEQTRLDSENVFCYRAVLSDDQCTKTKYIFHDASKVLTGSEHKEVKWMWKC